ncbi:MAG: hypothetical protein QM701_00920 [Propionivibrio sp.]
MGAGASGYSPAYFPERQVKIVKHQDAPLRREGQILRKLFQHAAGQVHVLPLLDEADQLTALHAACHPGSGQCLPGERKESRHVIHAGKADVVRRSIVLGVAVAKANDDGGFRLQRRERRVVDSRAERSRDA